MTRNIALPINPNPGNIVLGQDLTTLPLLFYPELETSTKATISQITLPIMVSTHRGRRYIFLKESVSKKVVLSRKIATTAA